MRARSREAQQQRVDHGPKPIRRDCEAGVPGGRPLGERAGAGEQALELRGGGREDPLVDPLGGEVETCAHVVDVRQAVPLQGPRLRLQRHDLGGEPAAAVRLEDPLLDPGAELRGVLSQARRWARPLGVDLRSERGWAEVAVDQAGDQAVEPEGEQQVVAGDGIGGDHRAPPVINLRPTVQRCIRGGRGARGAS